MLVIKFLSDHQKSVEERVKIFIHVPNSSFSFVEVKTYVHLQYIKQVNMEFLGLGVTYVGASITLGTFP